jgi:hypothetical protein
MMELLNSCIKVYYPMHELIHMSVLLSTFLYIMVPHMQVWKNIENLLFQTNQSSCFHFRI